MRYATYIFFEGKPKPICIVSKSREEFIEDLYLIAFLLTNTNIDKELERIEIVKYQPALELRGDELGNSMESGNKGQQR